MSAQTTVLAPPVRQDLRCTVARNDLLAALRFVAYCLPSRPAIPVLAGVLIHGHRGQLTLSAFDYEVHARQSVLSAGAEGRALVPGKLLQAMLTALDKGCEVALRVEGSHLQITGAGVLYTVPLLPVEDYPALPDPGPRFASWSGKEFADLARVVVAAGRDDTLPVLTGVLLDTTGGRLAAAATDRYRLAVYDTQIEAPAGHKLLVPARTFQWAAHQFRKDRDVHVHVEGAGGSGQIWFSAGARSASARLLDGEYPKYRSLLPAEPPTTVSVAGDELARGVAQVAISAERHTPVRLNLTADGIDLATGLDDPEHSATATKKVPAALTGEPMQIAFNPGYVLDGLRSCGSRRVTLGFTLPTKPGVMHADEDPAFTYLLMPVRVSG